jgi:hypothetical protein
MVLRFFPNVKFPNTKLPTVTLPKIICSNNQISELINVRNDKFLNWYLFELPIFDCTKFLNPQFLKNKIFEQKLVVPGVILSSLDLTNLT